MCGCDGTMDLYLRHDGSKGKYDASTPSVLSPAGDGLGDGVSQWSSAEAARDGVSTEEPIYCVVIEG